MYLFNINQLIISKANFSRVLIAARNQHHILAKECGDSIWWSSTSNEDSPVDRNNMQNL